VLSAPLSPFENVLAYVGAAATKSVILGLICFDLSSVGIGFPFKRIGSGQGQADCDGGSC
jgi:hypothetical protein